MIISLCWVTEFLWGPRGVQKCIPLGAQQNPPIQFKRHFSSNFAQTCKIYEFLRLRYFGRSLELLDEEYEDIPILISESARMSSAKDVSVVANPEAAGFISPANKDNHESPQSQPGVNHEFLGGAILIQPDSTMSPDDTQRLGLVIEEFTLFPTLPPELRRKIWALAAPPPTFIRKPWRDPDTDLHKNFNAPCRRVNGIPAVLHGCQESRNEFLCQDSATKTHPTYTFVQGVFTTEPEYGFYVALQHDILFVEDECKITTQIPLQDGEPIVV
jgi:hypothetical protein